MDEPRAPQDSKKLVRNLKLILSYDGSEFAGWQVQPDRSTIQGALASAIGRLTGENVLPQGSGRTDAGVHALAQVASFATAAPIPTENWVKALNDILPASIRVLAVSEAGPDFHARTTARAKTYRYRILRAPICPPFLARYVWHYPFPLDEDAIVAAAAIVVGEHDFTSFAAADPERVARMSIERMSIQKEDTSETAPTDVDSMERRASAPVHHGLSSDARPRTTNVRTITSSTWIREGEELIYTVRGNGFLHHMVRNLVGTFILLGKRTLSEQDFRRILQARNRSAAGPTAPASGLYLVGVEY